MSNLNIWYRSIAHPHLKKELEQTLRDALLSFTALSIVPYQVEVKLASANLVADVMVHDDFGSVVSIVKSCCANSSLLEGQLDDFINIKINIMISEQDEPMFTEFNDII